MWVCPWVFRAEIHRLEGLVGRRRNDSHKVEVVTRLHGCRTGSILDYFYSSPIYLVKIYTV